MYLAISFCYLIPIIYLADIPHIFGRNVANHFIHFLIIINRTCDDDQLSRVLKFIYLLI